MDAGFWWLHRLFRSRVRREPISVYELDPQRHGVFDIALMFGVLYHVRHPLLALDKLRRVCNGVLVVETHVVSTNPMLPMSLFYMDDVFFGPTNWTGPTEAAVVHWLRSAGFPYVYAQRDCRNGKHDRQMFIACADAAWAGKFQNNPNFQFCDSRYFQQSRAAMEELLALTPETKAP
jgi:tRNA (mo5U34)-methyltransferase